MLQGHSKVIHKINLVMVEYILMGSMIYSEFEHFTK